MATAALASTRTEEIGMKAIAIAILLVSAGPSTSISARTFSNGPTPVVAMLIGPDSTTAPSPAVALAIPLPPGNADSWVAAPVQASSYPPLATLMPEGWFDSARKRSRLRISVDILELLKEGPLTAFEIAFRLRLNSKRTKKYLEFLKQEELVECKDEERTLYRITPVGISLIDRARSVLFLDR